MKMKQFYYTRNFKNELIDLYIKHYILSKKQQRRLSYIILGTYGDVMGTIKDHYELYHSITKEEYENINLIEENVTMTGINKEQVPYYVRGDVLYCETETTIKEDRTLELNIDIIVSYNRNKDYLNVKIKLIFDLEQNSRSIQEEFTKKELNKHLELIYPTIFSWFI